MTYYFKKIYIEMVTYWINSDQSWLTCKIYDSMEENVITPWNLYQDKLEKSITKY